MSRLGQTSTEDVGYERHVFFFYLSMTASLETAVNWRVIVMQQPLVVAP